MAHHTPYDTEDDENDEETTTYEFTGNRLSLPGRATATEGDTVDLPERVANSLDDVLEEADETHDGDGEGDGEDDLDATAEERAGMGDVATGGNA